MPITELSLHTVIYEPAETALTVCGETENMPGVGKQCFITFGPDSGKTIETQKMWAI